MVPFPLATRPTELYGERCLNLRHYDAGCSRCATICPAQAITVEGGSVALEAEQCLGCGLCLHACPAEVFETSRWRERIPLLNVDDLKADAVEFFCRRHPHPEAGQRDVDSIQIPTCLAAMSAGVWFELGLKKTVRVRLDACAKCPLVATCDAVACAVGTANSWLRDAGYTAKITCVTDVDEASEQEPRAVMSGEHARMSRRGFFRSLFSAGKPVEPASLDTFDVTWHGDESPKQQPHLPAWMAHAARAYAQNARPTETPTATWPAITVSAACVDCNACVNYCPTGTLKSEFSAGEYVITFNAGQCVDCRICWASCPAGAITRSQAPALEPFRRRTVLQRTVATCAHCGRPAEPDQTVCYWCAKEPPLASVMTDARRWLFAIPVATRVVDHAS